MNHREYQIEATIPPDSRCSTACEGD